MVRSLRFFLVGLVLVVGVLLSLNFVVAWVDCWQFEEMNGGTAAACNDAGCVVTSDDGDVSGYTGDVVTDFFCSSDYSNYCCMQKMCWQYDATSEELCQANDGTMNCTWNSFSETWTLMNGTDYTVNGTCHGDWGAMGDDFGGAASGCWQYDANKQVCMNNENQQTCSWKENDANQNPWCWIQSLGDAQMENSLATTDDIGCCEQKGCWSYDGNETLCVNGSFAGLCTYMSKDDDPWCPNAEGCCYSKSCYEIGDNATLCNLSKMQMMMPCEWDGSACQDMCGGGFMFFNDSDSCFNQGGWYNSTGDCVMPSGGDFGAGGGGFMFGGEAHCWFADNQPLICENITGCAYCSSGNSSTSNDIANATDNICYGREAGLCEGRNAGEDDIYTNANNSVNLLCSHIQIKSACNYGPLPNCVWNSSVNLTGAFCAAGASSVVKSAPPVGFCEHPDSKNNYTLCTELIEQYMMPCVWDNSSVIVKNCTFNPDAVFGFGGEKDIGSVGSDTACTASGGTWQTEYYIEDDILKQDSWCEMTGFFSVDDGVGKGNKGNCDTSCWACEFQNNGAAWADVSVAEAACVGSALGYCRWTNDSSVGATAAFNGFGWCDYPQEMELGGASDCDNKCEDCDFMNNPYDACVVSVADNGTGCQWVNDSAAGVGEGYCVNKKKKVCTGDCFSCYDVTACQNSNVNCSWDSDDGLCSPSGYSGEICFNGKDDDADGMIDCGDPDCGFDNFCGGAAFGGDCFEPATEGDCNQTFAFIDFNGNSLNCSWVTDDWNDAGWCDMPGTNCWKYDNNLSACGDVAGCTNDTSSSFSGGMCDINVTMMDAANCWQYDANESYCTSKGGTNCQWKNDTWCAEHNDTDSWCQQNQNAGWCDFKPFALCMGLNESACGGETNCTWQTDDYSYGGGWCDVACFNWSLEESDCAAAAPGLCEWRNMSDTCQPEMFMMMGQGTGGKTGCWQYDGNETACTSKNVTCTYKNDTYANNNVSSGESSGWCMDKAEYEHFGDMEGGVVELAMDSGNSFGVGGSSAEEGVGGEVDLMGMGMRTTDEGFNFGAGVFNMTSSIICNGYNVGARMEENGSASAGTMGDGNASGSFYWYLDTDGSESGGCNAIGDGGTVSAGYDFMVSYVARNDSTLGVVETKQLMRCFDSSWVATNALVTTSKKLSCGEIGGVMIALSKQDLESFANYNKTANMRIFMTSADSSHNRTYPSDELGPGYYTKGMLDFSFVDCSDPNTKDPKCKNLQKFGFNVFEECMNGLDDDENGLADCDDPACVFMPKCTTGAAFSFVADADDKTAPTVMFSEVDKLSDGAFMKIDTNEPSNLSVQFYYNDSSCTILNTTLNDVGIEAYQNYSNFKSFHAIDLINESYSLGYALSNGTAYYYKVIVCDPSGNCGVSACANFTTRVSLVDKKFIFKMDLPDGYTVDIPALNKTGYNFSETFTINGEPITFDVGIKTNTSITKNEYEFYGS